MTSATIPGMPWDPSDPADPNNFHLGKDHYNRLHLPELEQTHADIDRMQHSLDELMAEPSADDGAIYALQTQLAAVKNHLQGYQAVQAELNSTDGPRRYLGQLDEFGRGAIALNNPDMATHNAILVPGTGQDLTTIGGADAKALAMYNAALQADRSLGPQDVAVTTWMGYDRPMSLEQADFPDPARAGAAEPYCSQGISQAVVVYEDVASQLPVEPEPLTPARGASGVAQAHGGGAPWTADLH
jgi:hypothetical protein